MERTSTVHKNKISKSIAIIYKIRPYLDKALLKTYILLLCTHILYIVLRYGKMLVMHTWSQLLRYKKDVLEQLLSLVILSKLSHYLENLKY